MSHKARTYQIVIAAVVTAALLFGIKQSNLPIELCGQACLSGTSVILYSLALGVLASIPGIAYLRYRKIPYAVAISCFAALEAYWISFGLVPLIGPAGWLLLTIASSLAIVACYLIADLIFNHWATRLRWKILVAILTVIATPIGILLLFLVTQPSY